MSEEELKDEQCEECGSKNLDVTAYGFDYGSGYCRARCKDCEYTFEVDC